MLTKRGFRFLWRQYEKKREVSRPWYSDEAVGKIYNLCVKNSSFEFDTEEEKEYIFLHCLWREYTKEELEEKFQYLRRGRNKDILSLLKKRTIAVRLSNGNYLVEDF